MVIYSAILMWILGLEKTSIYRQYNEILENTRWN